MEWNGDGGIVEHIMWYLWHCSVQGQFGVNQCTCLKVPWNSKMADHRAKQVEAWDLSTTFSATGVVFGVFGVLLTLYIFGHLVHSLDIKEYLWKFMCYLLLSSSRAPRSMDVFVHAISFNVWKLICAQEATGQSKACQPYLLEPFGLRCIKVICFIRSACKCRSIVFAFLILFFFFSFFFFSCSGHRSVNTISQDRLFVERSNLAVW